MPHTTLHITFGPQKLRRFVWRVKKNPRMGGRPFQSVPSGHTHTSHRTCLTITMHIMTHVCLLFPVRAWKPLTQAPTINAREHMPHITLHITFAPKRSGGTPGTFGGRRRSPPSVDRDRNLNFQITPIPKKHATRWRTYLRT